MSDNHSKPWSGRVRRRTLFKTGAFEMELAVKKSGELAVISVSGIVDLAQSPDMRQKMLGLVGEGVKGLVVDLSGVKYLDSSGMATLVDMLNRLQTAGGRMVVAGLAVEMREMFRITRLDRRFMFAEDAGIAVEKIRKALRDGA